MEDLKTLAALMQKTRPSLEIAKVKLKNFKLIESKSVKNDTPIVCERDFFAESLLPRDAAKFIAGKTTGDGNCLFNAVSLGLCGTEELASNLRVVTAAELFLHSSVYSNHPNLRYGKQHGILSQAVYEEILFPEDVPGPLSSQKVELEAIKTCQDKRWCSLIHVYALAGALCRTIQSVYPEANNAIRPMYNTLIEPVPNETAEGRRGLVILWSRDGSMDKTSKFYQPNHFVPLKLENHAVTADFDDIPDEILVQMYEREFPQTNQIKWNTMQTATQQQEEVNITVDSTKGEASYTSEFETEDETPLSDLMSLAKLQKLIDVNQINNANEVSHQHLKEDADTQATPDHVCDEMLSGSTSISAILEISRRVLDDEAVLDDQVCMDKEEKGEEFVPQQTSSPAKEKTAFEFDTQYEMFTSSSDSSGASESEESDANDETEAENEEDVIPLKWQEKKMKVKTPKFIGPKPGPTQTLSLDSTELQYFHIFFPEAIYDEIAQATNEYVITYRETMRKKKKLDWEDEDFHVTSRDIKAYLGIRMVMSLCQNSSIDDYWSDSAALMNPLIKRTMTRNYFKKLQRYFHLPTEKNDEDPDPLEKVKTLLDHVKKQCLNSYNLHQPISVDEAMIKCHAKHFGIVGAPNKPAKRGFKVFVLADGSTGYLSNFEVYLRGKKEIGLSQNVVERLVTNIENRNHIIYVDKFYTSIPLALSLLEKKTYICGSFNLGRKFWPSDMKPDYRKPKSQDKVRSLKRGEAMFRQSKDGKLVATLWMDKALVANLTTCYSPEVSKTDLVKRRTRNAAGGWDQQELECPESIKFFNMYMGGVDRHDHLRSSYSLQRPSVKWWHYVMWFAIDIALINGYIIMKDRQPKTTHKKFQLNVAMQLIAGYQLRKRVDNETDPTVISVDALQNHRCIKHEARGRTCRNCSKVKTKTPAGRVRSTKYMCEQCGIHLHPECFDAYHTSIVEKPTKKDVGTQTSVDEEIPEVQSSPRSTNKSHRLIEGENPELRRSPRKAKKRLLNPPSSPPNPKRRRKK